MNRRTLFILISVTIFLSSLLKLYYAYICSLYIYCDTAIMGSIAKQILKGEFPLFFYGGFYTWVIESWIIAVFFFLFGISNFTIYLGPVFVSILFLISIYFLGKELKNKEVGIFALIYSAFPPFYFFKYGVIPVGYLVELPLFGNLIFLLAFIIIHKRSTIYFLLLGALSAVIFWLHFISLYYLVSAAIFLLINMIVQRKFIYYIWGGICSLLAFFIVGLPCWLFNIKYNFASFSFSNTAYSFNILYGLKRFITYQVPGILGNNVFNILIFIFGIILLIVSIRPTRAKNIHKNWLFVFFIVSMVVLFSQGGSFTRSGDYRYIIPVFSFVPISAAYFLDWVNKKIKLLGTGILCISIILNIYIILNSIIMGTADIKKEGEMYEELIKYCEKHKIDGIYGTLKDTSTINFMAKDKVSAAEIINSANPVDEKIISARRIAYISWHNFKPIIDMLCKSYKYEDVNRFNTVYDFTPWGYYGEEIEPVGWKARSNYNSGWAGWAFDRNLDRYWSSIIQKKPEIYYEIEFPKAYTIYKFQVFNMPSEFSYRNFPINYRFYVSLDGKNWELISKGPTACVFWSGPHLLWRYIDTRWEVIFKPVMARFVRIENTDKNWYNTPWEINEIYFYEYKGIGEYKYKDYIHNAKRIYEYLVKNNISFVYADYWLSEKIRQWSNGRIKTLRVYNNSWPERPETTRFVKLERHTAIIVDSENDKSVRSILNEFGLAYSKKNIKDYVCFSFPNANEYLLSNLRSIYWTGIGIAKINLRAFGKLLMDHREYLKAVKYFPENPNLRYKLLGIYKREKNLYAREKQFIKHRLTPEINYNIKFSEGISFLGLSLEKLSQASYRISYFWELQKNLADKIFIFVHFIKDGKIVFQNDHPLLEQFVRLPVIEPDIIWKESYIIKIPPALQENEYTIKLGLWMPERDNKRLKIAGSKSTSIEIGKIKIEQDKNLRGLKGKIVFQSNATGNNEIYTMDADGRNTRRLTNTKQENCYPNWSPDGKSIIFMSNRDGNNEIYIMDREGNNQKNLSNSSSDDINPSWHPDGKRIIFTSNKDGAMNFYLINTDGAGLMPVTNFKSGAHDMARISPDGKEVIFTSNMEGGWQLFKMDINGENIQRITDLSYGHCEGAWSHDGSKILYVSRQWIGNSEIYTMNKDGSDIKKITDHPALNYKPRFSPDDKKVLFTSERDGNWELYLMNIDGTEPVRITYTSANEEWHDWTGVE